MRHPTKAAPGQPPGATAQSLRPLAQITNQNPYHLVPEVARYRVTSGPRWTNGAHTSNTKVYIPLGARSPAITAMMSAHPMAATLRRSERTRMAQHRRPPPSSKPTRTIGATCSRLLGVLFLLPMVAASTSFANRSSLADALVEWCGNAARARRWRTATSRLGTLVW